MLRIAFEVWSGPSFLKAYSLYVDARVILLDSGVNNLLLHIFESGLSPDSRILPITLVVSLCWDYIKVEVYKPNGLLDRCP